MDSDSDSESIVCWSPTSSPSSIAPWTPPIAVPERNYVIPWTPHARVPEKCSEASLIVPWSENTPQSVASSVVPWSESDGPSPQSVACVVGDSPQTPVRSKKIAVPSKLMRTPVASAVRKKIDFQSNDVAIAKHKKGICCVVFM
jgi:hypothetical protein